MGIEIVVSMVLPVVPTLASHDQCRISYHGGWKLEGLFKLPSHILEVFSFVGFLQKFVIMEIEVSEAMRIRF